MYNFSKLQSKPPSDSVGVHTHCNCIHVVSAVASQPFAVSKNLDIFTHEYVVLFKSTGNSVCTHLIF